MKTDEGDPKAYMFYVAYTKDDAAPRERPITFCFNGGPGSASVWLHLGAFGPRRVEMVDPGLPPPPPYRLVDNAEGLLDTTDLVFIDPVGTGFSRGGAEGGDGAWQTVEADVAAVAEFVWRYLQRTGRWNAPRFVAGESYGSTRAVSLAHALQEMGLMLNGLILVSPALSFQQLSFDPGNDLAYQAFLPTYAATAWYHDRLPEKPADLPAFLAEVRRFAEDVYGPALMRGARLSEAEAATVALALHRYTGLPLEELLAADLRITDAEFTKAVLRTPGQTVGRLDSRFRGPDTAPRARTSERDPSYDGPLGPYAGLINHYLRQTLGFDPTEPYVVFSMAANERWRWYEKPEKLKGYIEVADHLRRVMTANPHLKVLVTNGYFDLATPFYATEHALDHLGVDRALYGNIELTWYPAGHMMYLHAPSRRALRADVIRWLKTALAGADSA
ncbi:MAG: alpha/beta hydrolase [Myxococcales bacterium]|nr:alpha/beta hydrolase [Myxococcales bacterium]